MSPETSGPIAVRGSGLSGILSGTPGRVGLIVLVLAIAAAALHFATDVSPRESNRVTHPGGYSMIKPADWDSKIDTQTNGEFRDGLSFSPKSWKGLPPSIWVKRFAVPQDGTSLAGQGFAATTFQGQPAWQKGFKERRYSIREIEFQRGNDWYLCGLALPDAEIVRVDDWWRFVESFRSPS